MDPNPNAITFDTTVAPAPAPPEPVNIGGSRNTLGLGSLVGEAPPGAPSDGYWLAVNTYCSDKVNGDRFQSGSEIGWRCGGPVNSEFRRRVRIRHRRPKGEPALLLTWDASLKPGASPIDRYFGGFGDENFTFSLYSADNTPLDNNDNPLLCTKTFSSATPFELSFLGSPRWNNLCTIATNQPSGRYLVRVRNKGDIAPPQVNGENGFGLAAVYESQGLDPAFALCDGRTDSQCPVVSGLARPRSVSVPTPPSLECPLDPSTPTMKGASSC